MNWDSYLGDGTSYDDAPFNDLNSGGKDPDEDWDRPIKDVGKSLQEQLEDQLRLWNGTRNSGAISWAPNYYVDGGKNTEIS